MTKPSTDTAQASPTTQFFVSMLTRDISLADDRRARHLQKQ